MAQAVVQVSADIKGAVADIRKFEQELKKLEGIKSKGKSNSGVISKSDVEEFSKTQQEFQKNYASYVKALGETSKKLRRESLELSRSIRLATTDDAKKIYQQKLEALKMQQSMLEAGLGKAGGLNQQQYAVGREVQGMRTGGDTSVMLAGMGGKALGVGALLVAGTAMFKYASEGYQMAKAENRQSMSLGVTSAYGGNLKELRKSAETSKNRSST